MAKIEKSEAIKCWHGCRGIDTPKHCLWDCHMFTVNGESSLEVSCKVNHIWQPNSSVKKKHVHIKPIRQIFIVALPIIAQSGNNTDDLQKENRELPNSHTMEHYSTVKKNKRPKTQNKDDS